jgi:GNAT superfamily N-acetyltransferase
MVEFRSAVLKDFDRLAQFKRDIHALHVEHARNFYREMENPLTVEELQGAIERKDGRGAYVLQEDGRLVGYAFTKVVEIRSNPMILDQKLLFIEDMYIERQLRRKGHGRRLMRGLQQVAA